MDFKKSAQSNGYEAPECSTLIFSADGCFLQGSASTSINNWTEDPTPLSF